MQTASEQNDQSEKLVAPVHFHDGAADKALKKKGIITGTGDNFIAYNNVTEENVLAWVKSKLGSHQVTLLENAVKKDIAIAKQPKKIVGTPW